MPAVSKSQQKFMGMVHAAQKGEKPASAKVAKVAKKMKKKSAKDFASTKHKGLPYKVKQEIINKLRELVRRELEENFYDGTKKFEKKRTKNAEVLGYKLTGTPDVKTELSSTKGEERVLKRLGDTLKEELYNSQGSLTDFKKGDLVKDINPDCPHHGSEGEVTKVGKGTIFFKVTNDGKTYSEGDELEKTVDQMVKIKESVDENVGTKKYDGKDYFWPMEFKHYLRDASPKQRKLIHNAWLKIGVPVKKDGQWAYLEPKSNQKKKAWVVMKKVLGTKDFKYKGTPAESVDEYHKFRGYYKKKKKPVKKEDIAMLEAKFTDDTLVSRLKHWSKQHKGTGIGYGHVLGHLAVHMKEMGWNKSYKEVARIAVELGKKKKVESVNEGTKAFLAYRKMKEGMEDVMKSIRELRGHIDNAPYNKKFNMITSELYKWEIDLEKKWRRVVPQISNISKDKMLESVNEGFSSSLVKKAIDIAKKMSDNMTGAVKKIEKIKKGLSDDSKVKAALRTANESTNEGGPGSGKPKEGSSKDKSKKDKEKEMERKAKDQAMKDMEGEFDFDESVNEKMGPKQYHQYLQYVFDTQFKTSDEKKMKKSMIKKINKSQKKKGLPIFKEGLGDKFQKNIKKYQDRIEKEREAYKKAREAQKKRNNESVNEAKESAIDIAKRVVKNKQYEKGSGWALDLTTANYIVKIYDAYKDHPSLKKQMDKMPMKKLVKIAQKVMR